MLKNVEKYWEDVRDAGRAGGYQRCRTSRRVSEMQDEQEGVRDAGRAGGCQRCRASRTKSKYRSRFGEFMGMGDDPDLKETLVSCGGHRTSVIHILYVYTSQRVNIHLLPIPSLALVTKMSLLSNFCTRSSMVTALAFSSRRDA